MNPHLVVSVEKGRWNTIMEPMFIESLLSPRHCSWNVSYFSYYLLEALGAHLFSSVQSLSLVRLFVTSWTAAHQASMSTTNFQSLLKLMSIKSVMPFNHLTLCCPLLLPSFFPSTRVFSNESVLHIRWPKDWSVRFSISPSNEYSELIFFRMDWLDLLAV